MDFPMGLLTGTCEYPGLVLSLTFIFVNEIHDGRDQPFRDQNLSNANCARASSALDHSLALLGLPRGGCGDCFGDRQSFFG
jgi:hypothetical protein